MDLRKARGVIHVGANVGQEAEVYAGLRLPVVWVEPAPDTFKTLLNNTSKYALQKCYNYLISDVDDVLVDFHVASNNGISSSMFDFAGHKEVLAWQTINMVGVIQMRTITLDTMLTREGIDKALYDHLVVDTQGADLKVLKGADLTHIKSISVEVSDFEAYKGGCVLSDVQAFMTANGFKEDYRFKFAWHPKGGSYWDIIYLR